MEQSGIWMTSGEVIMDSNTVPGFVVAALITLGAAYFAYHQLRYLRLSYFRKLLLYENIRYGYDVPLPTPCASAQKQLFQLGFDIIGILEGYYRSEKAPLYEYWYSHADKVISACIVPFELDEHISFLLTFVSMFNDETVIKVAYPIGENIDTASLISRYTRESVERAFDYHLQRVNEWSLTGKVPLPFQTMGDVKKFDELFMAKFRRIDSRRVYLNLLLQGVLGFIIAFAGVLVMMAILRADEAVMYRWIIIGGISFGVILLLGIVGIKPAGAIETISRGKKG